MSRFDSVRGVVRVLTVFFAYSVAVQTTETVFDSSYLRVVVALFAALCVALSIDAIPALLRGETPTFGEGSYFYSACGILAIIAYIFVTAVFADGLRSGTSLPEWLAVAVAAVGAAVLVFGGLVAYYWRRHSIAEHSG